MADTRPSHVPVWATTTLYATSNDPTAVGQPTKNSPASIEAQGWDYATRPDPTHYNYWQNEVGQWCQWVNDTALSTDGGSKTMSDVLELMSQGITFSALASCIISATGGFFIVPGATAQVSGELEIMSAGKLTCNSGSTIEGEIVLDNGTLNVQVPTLIQEDVEFDAGARRGNRYDVGAGDANQTINSANTDFFKMPAGVLGAGRLAIMLNGSLEGETARLYNYDQTNALTLKKQDGTTAINDNLGNAIKLIGNPTVPGDHFAVVLVWTGSTWEYAG